MFKEEFKRLFFSTKTVIVMVVLVSISMFSFYTSYKEKQEFIDLYNRRIESINQDGMKELIDNYNGIQFDLDFFLTSDAKDIFVIILFLFLGVFVSSNLFGEIENGYVNYIISRTKYSKYLKNKVLASNAYIAVFLFITFFIISIIGFFFGGIGSGLYGIGHYTINLFSFILVLLAQYLIVTLLCILANTICMLSCVFIKKRFIIQSLPFVIFLILPLLLASSMSSLIRPLGELFSLFSPFDILYNIYFIFQRSFSTKSIILAIIPYIIYTIIAFIIWKIHLNKMEKDCL